MTVAYKKVDEVKWHLRELKKELKKQVDVCKEYNPFCFSCIAWQSFKTLEEVFKIK